MGDIVNLRNRRKQKARDEREQQAAANRAHFGQPKAERKRLAAEQEIERRRHEAHKVSDE